jgi:DNA-binding CsgD family transcriptional regulator
VTALVFQGRSTRQIARALSISPYTVQEHLTSIFDKVGCPQPRGTGRAGVG